MKTFTSLGKIFICAILAHSASGWAYAPPLGYPFPLTHYDQNFAHWRQVKGPQQQPLLTPAMQQKQLQNFYNHFIGSASAWDVHQVTAIIKGNLQTAQTILFNNYANDQQSNARKKGRGACNVAPYGSNWLMDLKTYANLAQFNSRAFDAKRFGIAVTNVNARALPTSDSYFHSCDLPGEGDSFDYLQVSALWAGTPVYILGATIDEKWFLISCTDYIAWVPSSSIAKTSAEFIATYQQAAHALVAINSPVNLQPLTVSDEASGTARFTGYIGAVFPLAQTTDAGFHILIPVLGPNQQAQLEQAFLTQHDAALMPLTPSTDNFIAVINNLQGKPYGWGNLNIQEPKEFTYDCSSELKSLYTPFGIWLPRHSSSQVNPRAIIGTTENLSAVKNPALRIKKLMAEDAAGNDHRFTTVVYIGGHVFMYVGAYPNPRANNGEPVALTYQNLWGLRPLAGELNGNPFPDGRLVIGKSVLLPLLAEYPERYPYPVDRAVGSLADKSDFQIAHYDVMPTAALCLAQLTKRKLPALAVSELVTLMTPGE